MAATDRVGVIDGLRGVAIVLVVVFHVWQVSWIDLSAALHLPFWIGWLPRVGFIGVEVFFFISGFCLFYPFSRALQTGAPAPTWGEFYRRRALKIVPSYLLAIAVNLYLAREALPERLWWHLATHLTFTHTWFPQTYDSIHGVLWSLGVEGQFYLVFPWLCAAFRRRPLATFLAMTATAVVYRLAVGALSRGDGMLYTLRLNQLPGCLDLFAAGMLSAYLVVALPARKRRGFVALSSVLAMSALGVLGWILRLFEFHAFAGGPVAIQDWQRDFRLPIAGLLVLIAAFLPYAVRPARWLLANPGLGALAGISYNLYLWHKPIADGLLRARIPAPATADPHDDPRWQALYTALAIALSLVAATIVTWGFERPLMRWRRRRPLDKADVGP